MRVWFVMETWWHMGTWWNLFYWFVPKADSSATNLTTSWWLQQKFTEISFTNWEAHGHKHVVDYWCMPRLPKAWVVHCWNCGRCTINFYPGVVIPTYIRWNMATFKGKCRQIFHTWSVSDMLCMKLGTNRLIDCLFSIYSDLAGRFKTFLSLIPINKKAPAIPWASTTIKIMVVPIPMIKTLR